MAKQDPKLNTPLRYLRDNRVTAKSWIDDIEANFETFTAAESRVAIRRLALLVKQLCLIVLKARQSRVLFYREESVDINGTAVYYILDAAEANDALKVAATNTWQIPVKVFQIDQEVNEAMDGGLGDLTDDNAGLFAELRSNLRYRNAEGMPQYYIDVDGDLAKTEGWQRYDPR